MDSIRDFIWGKLTGCKWWPALVINPSDYGHSPAKFGYSWVFWFGDHKMSEISNQKILNFIPCFHDMFKIPSGKLRQKAIIEVLEILASMASISFLTSEDLVKWARDGFDNFEIKVDMNNFSVSSYVMKHLNQKLELNENSSDQSDMECSNDVLECSEIFIEKFKTEELNIKEICISCYGKNSPIISEHPLFHGGICLLCTERLKETIFVFGNDAKNICCIICSNPGLLVICENEKCPRSYCQKCLVSYLGNYIAKEIMECSSWTCFFCSNEMCKYLLKPRFDWEEKLMTLLKTENPSVNEISFENFTRKRPITVLSLFDGISTGKLVLDMLGISVNKYYSSEIDGDAINVSKLQHKNITYLGDVCKITESKINSLDDIDLIIGGSPCNDLSLVNPLRKGLYDYTGSGRLFFDFFHILCIVKRRNPNVLYLFENVTSMSLRDKRVISSFLMHEPALIDAIYFSSQRRARYFWGNIPGLHGLPKFWNSEPNEKEEILNDCILQDLGRKAVVDKIKTVTTQRNSLIQEKCSVMPVVMNDEPDVLWVTELEKIFGFPLHYTDTGNLGITKRRELLGRAWSVPVIRTILQPLKFFFKCK